MASRCSWILLAILTTTSVEATAQTGRVEIASANAKELNRTAHRLQIPPERLQKARAALDEATELARRVEPSPQPWGSMAELWVRFHRSAAAERIELLAGRVRVRAADATDLAGYQTATSVAVPLLSAYAVLDEERAMELARRWPAPPGGAGKGGEAEAGGLERSLQRSLAERLAHLEPERSVKAAEAAGPAEETSYLALGQLAVQRNRAGRRDEALGIADRAIAAFERVLGSGAGAHDAVTLVQCLAEIDNDRAVRAVAVLARAEAVAAARGPEAWAGLRRGEQTVALTPTEAWLVAVLMGLLMRPELSVRALAAAPDLEAKLQALGGLDALLPGGPMLPTIELTRNAPGAPMDLPWWTARRLYAELRGKMAGDSRDVEHGFEAQDPRTLIALAQQARWENPELASLALERAAGLATHVEPVEQRVDLMVYLIRVTQQIEGEVDGDLLAQGLRAVETLRSSDGVPYLLAAGSRKAPGEETEAYHRTGMTRTDLAEAAMLGDYARADYDAALRLVRRMPGSRRLGALVQVAMTLGRP